MFCKKQRILVWILAIVMVIGMMPMNLALGEDGTRLIADNLQEGTFSTDLVVNGFTIKATGDKSVVIDGSSKTADDGTNFSRRIKLGGTGTVDYRSIHFNVSKKTEVEIYAMSSSSSSDRILALYNLSGELIGEVDALGTSIAPTTIMVEAGDYYLLSPSSGVNVYGVVLTQVVPTEMVLGISSLEDETIVATKEINGFIIKAAADKSVVIDSSSKSATDGTVFTKRMKLGGSGTVEARSIHFTVTGDSQVTPYAMSSSSSSDRKLGLYAQDGTLVGEMDAKGTSLESYTFNVAAGDYYLASPSSGVNVYEVKVVTGEPVAIVREPWETVTGPAITFISQDNSNVEVMFTLVTGDDGADKANVSMMDTQGIVLESALVGKSEVTEKSATFNPSNSGTYLFQVEGVRNDEETTKLSSVESFNYVLPLGQPIARAFNQLDGSVLVKWFGVKEAESYMVEYRITGSENYTETPSVSQLETAVEGLEVGTNYDIRVKAIRGEDVSTSEAITKTVKAEDEREWNFSYFGQSVSSSRNVMEMLDPDNLMFKLNSCTVKDDGVTIDGKGGKFTTFHDGISYYYTVVDPETENFELTATFYVDYINSTPDGQEGFGLLAMDSLGSYGVSSVNHYTNSAGIIATKFETTIDEVKYTGKDVLGSRFVTGITPEVLDSGDSAIAQNGKNVNSGYGYSEDDLVKTGGTYTLTLKKTNTGYHTLLDGEERILYGVDKLLQLDPENLYVGFAVARGCNVTVSDVHFTTSNPETDAPAVPEPAVKVSYVKKIDSPTTSGNKYYSFVYVSDVPGTLTVKDADNQLIINEVAIESNVDFVSEFKLKKGVNDYNIFFTPESGYIPGPNEELDSYETVALNHQVTYRSFSGASIYVSPEGSENNSGTKTKPVDIATGVAFATKGQTIYLAGGTYEMEKGLVIQRGIDGAKEAYIAMRATDDSRAILDFSNASAGMSLWGDYWFVENIDITNTVGNVKGLQVAGSNNIISQVDAYKNGDTGIQISGTGAETFEKWPANNLIINCTSYDNIDPGQNNADGFAAKITVADGNVFRGCMAYNNLDDGWDLFAKIESGPIGIVTIENCITFNNGTLTDGVGNGDGNGFKLGGDGIAVAHKLINSISYNNNADGVTSNSNPAVVLENVISYGNKGRNVALYGKGTGDRDFVVDGLISMAGLDEDNISEMPSLVSETNYFWLQGFSKNQSQLVLTDSIFQSVDMSILPTRSVDGSIDMQGLLVLLDQEAIHAGALLEATPCEEPTVLKLKPAKKLSNTVSNSIESTEVIDAIEAVESTGVTENELKPETLDIIVGHWIESDYRKLFAKGIVTGQSEDLETKVNREKILVYLIRTLVPELSEESDPLQFAIESGWIKGYPNGTYGMEEKLTREQAMVILARVLKDKELVTLTDVDLSKYRDVDNISVWAVEDVTFVVKSGLVKGKTLSTLNPKDEITFAELLKIISNLYNLLDL